ncbi:MAG: HAD family hydrolase [Oxalobacter sp.]|nr:MAG: HAD family hydrolase [Oxalobacter sp.]
MVSWIVSCCTHDNSSCCGDAGGVVTAERRPALFLDRDGVINVDHGYVHKIEDFEFVDGIFGLSRLAIRLGYRLIVVTNQAGIGRGYYDSAAFIHLTKWMAAEFLREHAPLTAVYFCPHHVEHGVGEYRQDCFWRKPSPGMIKCAASEHNLNLRHSVVVGDKSSDMLSAERGGVVRRVLLSKEPDPNVLGAVHKKTLAEVSQWLVFSHAGRFFTS